MKTLAVLIVSEFTRGFLFLGHGLISFLFVLCAGKSGLFTPDGPASFETERPPFDLLVLGVNITHFVKITNAASFLVHLRYPFILPTIRPPEGSDSGTSKTEKLTS